MQISERLRTVAGMVSPGCRLADVGTDHAYIPIYLMQNGVIPQAVAMDINQGPLLRATENIRRYGLTGRIETRLSDGLEKLQAGEADTILIAGMGGLLMVRILETGRACSQAVGSWCFSRSRTFAAYARISRKKAGSSTGRIWFLKMENIIR